MCGEPFPSVELACGREKRLRPQIEGFSIKFRPGSIVALLVAVECTVVLHWLGLGLLHWAANRGTFQVPRGLGWRRVQAGPVWGPPDCCQRLAKDHRRVQHVHVAAIVAIRGKLPMQLYERVPSTTAV
jgi:hypothetical protein